MEENRTDLKTIWAQLGGRRVDIIFEQMQNVLLLLKQKIKNGTATNQEYCQASVLVNEANLGDLLTLTNAGAVFDGDGIQETKPKWQCLLTDDNTANSVEGSHRSKCACLQLTARGCSKTSSSATSHGYSYKRLEGPVPSGIYECSVLCRCDKMMCQNRVVQHGIQVRLQVFNTERKGWGVRCLDDIDKGTFVCTYSGRLMSRAKDQVLGDDDQELREESAVSDRVCGFFSKKRKLHTDCSETVIGGVQTGRSHILEKEESLSQTVDNENKSTLVHPRNLSNATARMPGTRRVVFHNHPLKMENDTLAHIVSSDEDNSSQTHQSSKLTSETKKGKEKSTQRQKEEHPMEIGQTESADMDSAECKRKRLSLQGVDCDRADVLDDTSVTRPSKSVPLKGGTYHCKEEKHRHHQKADDDRMLLKNADEENIYILDASKEGNVGRFLNHSCCPNLFAQSVFVETHNRNFPWVAFFTNRHVKAGAELTWDYGYEAGSMPEVEISCQCGVQKCRKKTL
ncbi:histone-lysine N-methyltransferase SETDB2 isoform X6 [Falco naumanni]|uniref:histone-lysine N-methyltransferase SETDB2 isoform X6 n=1 Tax=Falco naumanni TaxID=148594 RepID=UPI001ADE8660|nr:histone-lysine N-methyltransferase SETDB2 isoform X6 [Falco naumanni]